MDSAIHSNNRCILGSSRSATACHSLLIAVSDSLQSERRPPCGSHNGYNVSERTLRHSAIGRKNWLFLGDDDAGKTAAILFSLMASAKRNELEPWAYLKDVINGLSAEAGSPSEAALAALLPDAWLSSHPESHRRYSR